MFLSYLTNSPSSLLPQKFSKRSSTFLSFWTITLRTQPHQPPTTSLRNEKRVWQQPNFGRENCPAFPHAKIQRYFRSRLYLEVYKSLKGKCETCRQYIFPRAPSPKSENKVQIDKEWSILFLRGIKGVGQFPKKSCMAKIAEIKSCKGSHGEETNRLSSSFYPELMFDF